MIAFPIVDAHLHIYDPNRFRYSWMQNNRVLDCPWLPQHFTAACGQVAVEKMVFVEVWVDSPYQLAEAQWVAKQAEDDPRIAGIVAAVPLEKGTAVEGHLDGLCELKPLRGVRRLIEIESDPQFCLQPDFIQGVQLLAKYNLSFDICIFHYQLPNVIKMVQRCPEIRFVLDHVGKPAIEDGLLEPWRSHIKQLAALPNVHCKLSGMTTEADHNNWTREQLRPYIDHVVEAFGFDRIMFGGDWPVSEQTHRYPEWVEIVEWVVEDCSEADKRKLFRDNAIDFYRLD